jgi:hypothetical protein
MNREDEILQLVYDYHVQYVGEERKFNDADIATEPELIDLALEYLTVYSGNFEYILDIKEKSGGRLSTGQARGVLNTALSEHNRNNNPISTIPYEGIVATGYYLLPGEAELEVRAWREDGTRLLRVLKQGRWDAFASIDDPPYSYRIWGKTNTPENRSLAQSFFNADSVLRLKWAEGWSEFTGLCYVDGHNKAIEGGMCENCATGKWATDTIREETPS